MACSVTLGHLSFMFSWKLPVFVLLAKVSRAALEDVVFSHLYFLLFLCQEDFGLQFVLEINS